MANGRPLDVVIERCAPRRSVRLFTRAFGARPSTTATRRSAKSSRAQAFQLEDPSFHPYSSKYDLHLDKEARKAAHCPPRSGVSSIHRSQNRKLRVCHFSDASLDDGSSAQLTDYSFEAIGVRATRRSPPIASARYLDLGIVRPARADITTLSGVLRPVQDTDAAQRRHRRAFFHNGVIHSLEQAIRFYNTRDTQPELWYPTVGGAPRRRPIPGFRATA